MGEVTMKLLTVDTIMGWSPCDDYPRERVQDLFGKGLTPLQVLDLFIPAEDRLWVVLRTEVIPEPRLTLLACDYAEEALPIYEAEYPGDPRVRNCIETRRRFVRGEATQQELDAAVVAAGAAAGADRYADRYAAWSAAVADRHAAWSAAVAAAWDKQVEMARQVLRELEGVQCG